MIIEVGILNKKYILSIKYEYDIYFNWKNPLYSIFSKTSYT